MAGRPNEDKLQEPGRKEYALYLLAWSKDSAKQKFLPATFEEWEVLRGIEESHEA